jgi:hypothetical protein
MVSNTAFGSDPQSFNSILYNEGGYDVHIA